MLSFRQLVVFALVVTLIIGGLMGVVLSADVYKQPT